jgi:hypothetical protein
MEETVIERRCVSGVMKQEPRFEGSRLEKVAVLVGVGKVLRLDT